MTLDRRVEALEEAVQPQEPVRIRVLRLPPEAIDLRGRELNEWIEQHPGEFEEKIVHVGAKDSEKHA
jgi:hypothetical protein